MVAIKDETGNTYERLTVLKRAPNIGKDVAWECICTCGNKKIVGANNLRRGHVRSCGCLARDITSSRSKKHGMTHTPEYLAWINIKRRCYNKSDPRSKNYLARGITMCDEWRNGFDAFFRDMGERPSSKHSIDRINNNGNYEQGNCRWATAKEQGNNRRTNTLVVIDGEKRTIQEWADHLQVGRHVIISIMQDQANS